MIAPTITILDTGVANIASVAAALARCGAELQIATDRQSAERAELLVLPGVGAFGAGMSRLARADLVGPIKERVDARRPTLAICLGLQLLCRGSQETPGAAGIGAIDAQLEAFPEQVRSPQYGWNVIQPGSESELVETGYAYFANSYRIARAPEGWNAAYADHGGRFVASLESQAVLVCQFHPELSGAWGARLLQRWLTRSREGVTC